MSVSFPTAPTTSWTTTVPQRGVVSRLVAGFLHVSTGVVLASAVLGLSVASAIIARGTVLAGIGMALGSRQSASLGIGLGAFDAVAGVVALFVAATGSRGQADGVGIAMTFVVMGIVLAVAARAADWNTHGPIDA